MKKVQHESAGPFVISLSTEEGSRAQSGREREGRQSGELPGSERSEAGREGGEEEARRRGALRAVAPTISSHFRLEKPGMKSASISLPYGKYNAFFFLSKSANSFLYISKTAASI